MIETPDRLKAIKVTAILLDEFLISKSYRNREVAPNSLRLGPASPASRKHMARPSAEPIVEAAKNA